MAKESVNPDDMPNVSEFGVKTNRYRGHYKVGAPYEVNNVKYYPKHDESYSEVGVASWYGESDGFHGKKTANGDVYHHRALTAAHRTLPMPSVVRVTNLENNLSVILMVNDRGPYSRKRIIDISARAAEVIKMKQKGSAKVKVEYLQEETNLLLAELKLKKPEESKYLIADNKKQKQYDKLATIKTKRDSFSKPFYIQLGSFKSQTAAKAVAVKYANLGAIGVDKVKDKNMYRVKIGPLKSRSQAELLLAKINKNGNKQAMIFAEK